MLWCGNWLLVKVLRPTRHKTGHFGDVPQANVLAWYGKKKQNLTQQKKTLTNQKKCTTTQTKHTLEMWANAQHDGHPAEYRWRPLFNAAKFAWRPLLECCAVTLPRRETHWNLQGCPKLPDRSQPLVDRNSPYCANVCRRYCCLTSFFPIVNTCLSCEDIARQSCAMVHRWPIFGGSCVFSKPRAAHFRPAF